MNFENLNVHILNECLNLYYYFPKFYNLDYDNETTEESTNKKFFSLSVIWINIINIYEYQLSFTY